VKVAYFTAGTVGVGHLVRGLAIRRALARAGFEGQYRIFGLALPFPAADEVAEYETVVVETDRALRDRDLAQSSRLAEQLRGYMPTSCSWTCSGRLCDGFSPACGAKPGF
jgi:hypothetical protein